MKDIKLQLPFPVERIFSIETSDMVWAETYLHQYFAKFRKNGEWFELGAEDVKWILSLTKLEPHQIETANQIGEAEVYCKQGRKKGERGNYKGAIVDFSQALNLNSNLAEAYQYRGLAYLRLGDFKYAIADFEQSASFYQKEGKSINEQEVRLKLRQAEVEKLNQAEAERLRQAEAEKLRQAKAERLRQAEAEKLRQAKAERLRQAEAEKLRQAEAEKHRQAEAEKLRQAEAERLRQAEAEKQKIYRNWGIGIFGLFCLGSIIGGLSNTPEQTQLSSPSSMLSANSKHSFPQNSCGNRSNNPDEIWYPVFVDGGNLDSIRSKLCRDAFSTFRRKTGKPTVQVASFTNYNRALEFAKAVGGEVGSPTPPTKTNLEN